MELRACTKLGGGDVGGVEGGGSGWEDGILRVTWQVDAWQVDALRVFYICVLHIRVFHIRVLHIRVLYIRVLSCILTLHHKSA